MILTNRRRSRIGEVPFGHLGVVHAFPRALSATSEMRSIGANSGRTGVELCLLAGNYVETRAGETGLGQAPSGLVIRCVDAPNSIAHHHAGSGR